MHTMQGTKSGIIRTILQTIARTRSLKGAAKAHSSNSDDQPRRRMAMTSDPHFGAWLQRVRKQYLHLTQEALATQLEYSRDTIHKIETGRRNPSKELAELWLI